MTKGEEVLKANRHLDAKLEKALREGNEPDVRVVVEEWKCLLRDALHG